MARWFICLAAAKMSAYMRSARREQTCRPCDDGVAELTGYTAIKP